MPDLASTAIASYLRTSSRGDGETRCGAIGSPAPWTWTGSRPRQGPNDLDVVLRRPSRTEQRASSLPLYLCVVITCVNGAGYRGPLRAASSASPLPGVRKPGDRVRRFLPSSARWCHGLVEACWDTSTATRRSTYHGSKLLSRAHQLFVLAYAIVNSSNDPRRRGVRWEVIIN